MTGANGSSQRGAQRGGQRVRKGEDPEGGERSAFKGFVGPSGLGLDHAIIPAIEKKVYDTLLPLVFRPEHPIPLSQFTQAACDALLPVLPVGSAGLSEHAFKSQWGRLNEFVCPRLAELRGLGDCNFNRQAKTVQLSLATDPPPPGFIPNPVRTVVITAAGGAAAGSAGSLGGDEEGDEDGAARGGSGRRQRRAERKRASGAGGEGETGGGGGSGSAAAVVPLPTPLGGTTAVAGGQQGLGAAPAAAVPQEAYATVLPAQGLCLYCGQGYHVIKQCPDFHAMLQTIYQAGYQAGAAAAQQAVAQQYQ